MVSEKMFLHHDELREQDRNRNHGENSLAMAGLEGFFVRLGPIMRGSWIYVGRSQCALQFFIGRLPAAEEAFDTEQ